MPLNELDIMPFGAQYYRAPTPLPDEWEKDIEHIAKIGFNTIKILLQWRWNQPAEHEFFYDDIDRILALCEKHGLKVIINIICDVAPAWFFAKYPDCLMVTNSGQRLHPQTTPYRQIGGCPGPCLNHPAGIELRRAFYEQMSRRYARSPAILAWDLWNEPELAVGIKRQDRVEDLVCYCDHCVGEFRLWLKDRFGEIGRLNGRWGRNYRSFDEVEAPRTGASFLDMIDWRMFFIDTVAADLDMRAKAIKKYDAAHPVMVHTVPMPYFNRMTSGVQDSLLAEKCDIYGNSVGSYPFSAAQTVSAAPGKTVLSSEVHAVGGSTFDRPAIPTQEDFKHHIFSSLGLGVKGFVFWQYRPELLGVESPAWGLTNPDGSETDWLGYAVTINDALQRCGGPLLRSRPARSELAIIDSAPGEMFTWCITGSVELHQKSIEGAFQAFYARNINADIISDRQASGGCLAQYKVVYYPFPYFMDGRLAGELKKFVMGGGTLISEAIFGGISGDDNLHATALPGFGFAGVFGATEGRVATASSFTNSYGGRYAVEQDKKFIPVLTAQGERLKGYFFREELVPGTASPIAFFEDGRIAATVNSCGSGRAIWIGSLPAYACYGEPEGPTGRFLGELAMRYGGVGQNARSSARVDILQYGGGAAFCVVKNTQPGDAVHIAFQDGAMAGKTLRNIITGDAHAISADTPHPFVRLPMRPHGIDCFAIE